MNITFPHFPGAGGPGSFQMLIEKQLRAKGFSVAYSNNSKNPDLIFVVGGTKQIGWLIWMKLKGVPILYRLDGIKWLHQFNKSRLSTYLLEEFRNKTSKFIHAFLGDHIIYQSQFAKDWWKKSGWKNRREFDVIYNGVDLNQFKVEKKNDPITLVILEGTVDYSPYSIKLLNNLRTLLPADLPIEVYGRFVDPNGKNNLISGINYKGFVEREEVPKVFQNAIYLSLDVNPACPNTVIEAMACGAPVVGYDTGALKELVADEAGKVVPYGSDPWKLEFPDAEGLADAIEQIRNKWYAYSKRARKVAEDNFDIDQKVDEYIQVMTVLKEKNE